MTTGPRSPLTLTRSTNNPYRAAASLLAHRVLWDLDPTSWISRRRLRALRDRHQGMRAVICCNGPSLNRVDFDALRGVFTFGLNKIHLLFARESFRPSCVVAVNELVLEQTHEFYNQTTLPLFLGHRARRWVEPRANVVFLHTTESARFARDCSISVHEGWTVTYVALQLAFHMGFSRVALVGCDHDFGQPGPANAAVTLDGPDRSHFDPAYFAGQRWNLPDLPASERSYALARDTFAAFGRKVVNATDGGRLELFERMSLTAFLSEAGGV